jgi:hypothetical protein
MIYLHIPEKIKKRGRKAQGSTDFPPGFTSLSKWRKQLIYPILLTLALILSHSSATLRFTGKPSTGMFCREDNTGVAPVGLIHALLFRPSLTSFYLSLAK